MKKDTIEEKPSELKISTPLPQKKGPTHRYLCEACTAVAFYFTSGDPIKSTVSCSCGAVRPFNPSNLVAL